MTLQLVQETELRPSAPREWNLEAGTESWRNRYSAPDARLDDATGFRYHRRRVLLAASRNRGPIRRFGSFHKGRSEVNE